VDTNEMLVTSQARWSSKYISVPILEKPDVWFLHACLGPLCTKLDSPILLLLRIRPYLSSGFCVLVLGLVLLHRNLL
jgi:hypothetical protein